LNKVVYVSSYGKPLGKNITKKISTGETKKGLFGGDKDVTKKVTEWEQTGYSDSEIDGEKLAKDIQLAVEQLNKDGYEVVCITETTSGRYNYDYKWSSNNNGGYGYGYGYGYSYTEGVTVIGKKIA